MSEKDTHEPEQNVTQPARRTKKKKRGKAGRIVRKTVKTVVVLAVIAGAGLFGLKAYIQKQAESSDSESYSRAVVTRGAMEETVYGTGTTSARNQTNVLAGADGTLTDLRVSVGDEVKAGDILAVLTNADLDDEITDLEFLGAGRHHSGYGRRLEGDGRGSPGGRPRDGDLRGRRR